MTTLDALPPRTQAKIRVDGSGCWMWTAFTDKSGYGLTRIPGIRTHRAHRAVYELLRGPVPADLVCDHLCRVRACVNPDHIEIVTQRVNVQRGDKAKLKYETHCAHGHELTGDNLRVRTQRDGRIRRDCRQCLRALYRISNARRRGQDAA